MQHILAYYKFPLVILCILLYFIGYRTYGHLTHKDVLLYIALVNVTTGETLTETLKKDFLEHLDTDTSAEKVELYTGLYLADNADDLALDPSLPYQAITQEHFYGLNLSETNLIRQAGFKDTVYLEVIANTPRIESTIEYIKWITNK